MSLIINKFLPKAKTAKKAVKYTKILYGIFD